MARVQASPFDFGRRVAGDPVRRGRQHDPRRAKIHFSYTVAEVAKLYGVHRNTVRGWIKAGLETIPYGRERLVLGSELRDFHARRRDTRRVKTPPGALYCFKCREPRQPERSLVELLPAPNGTGNVCGLCSHCGTLMHRRVALARLAQAGFSDLQDAGTATHSR